MLIHFVRRTGRANPQRDLIDFRTDLKLHEGDLDYKDQGIFLAITMLLGRHTKNMLSPRMPSLSESIQYFLADMAVAE